MTVDPRSRVGQIVPVLVMAAIALVALVEVEAGDYGFICFIPDPASGRSHAALRMVGGLPVQ